ncbi:MAG TPA: DoxX family protein [Thermoanaerobaculia bacterium]|nr:DoxX family protein [Thermoanaerobaculia bacterium]
MKKLIVNARNLIVKITGKLGWLAPTLARLCVGWLFMTNGWAKLHNLDQITEYFRSLGIPAPEFQAPFASATEFTCGTLILVGLFTRLAAVPLIVVMTVAIATAKKADLDSVSDLYGIAEYLYILLLVYLGVGGAGPLSLDRLLWWRFFETPDCAPEGLRRAERVA